MRPTAADALRHAWLNDVDVGASSRQSEDARGGTSNKSVDAAEKEAALDPGVLRDVKSFVRTNQQHRAARRRTMTSESSSSLEDLENSSRQLSGGAPNVLKRSSSIPPEEEAAARAQAMLPEEHVDNNSREKLLVRDLSGISGGTNGSDGSYWERYGG